MVAIPGEEAPADPLADLRAEACLVDPGADFLLAPVSPHGEAPAGLLSQADTGAAEPSLTMAHPTTDARALEAATKTRLQMWIKGQDLRHETPPFRKQPQGGTACFYFPQFPCNAGLEPAWDSGEARARPKAIGTVLCSHICREFFSFSTGVRRLVHARTLWARVREACTCPGRGTLVRARRCCP
jgi:hypothetical protein